MNQDRPYILDFSEYTKLCEEAIELLEGEYKSYLAKKRGVISIHDFDKKIFPWIVKQMAPLTEEENNVVEALFDSFCGAIVLHGSDQAFERIKLQAKGINPFL
jgi:hypothetical protein